MSLYMQGVEPTRVVVQSLRKDMLRFDKAEALMRKHSVSACMYVCMYVYIYHVPMCTLYVCMYVSEGAWSVVTRPRPC